MSEEDNGSSEVILSADSEDEQEEFDLSGDEVDEDSETDFESSNEDEGTTEDSPRAPTARNRQPTDRWEVNSAVESPPSPNPCGTPSTRVTGLGLNCNMSYLEILESFITPAMMTDIVQESNAFAEHIKNNKPNAMPRWKPLYESELWRFFAIELLMGIVKKPCIKDYWSTKELIRTPKFAAIMSRNRFEDILRALHFQENDGSVRNPNRFSKLGNFFPELLHNFRSCCVPGEFVSIDESLLLFKGRLAFIQYIPSKRSRFGIKFFLLVDCQTKIILNIIPYLGKNTPWDTAFSREVHGVGGIAVLTLMADCFGSYRKLVIDNWFSSVNLAEELLNRQTYVLGTVRKTRKRMPRMTPRKLPAGQIQTYKSSNCLIERWSDRREVLMLNTFMEHNMVNSASANPNNTRMKPATVLLYNKTMGAVDDVDRQLSPYENNRKTIKWYKKVAFRLLKWAVYQSYRVYLALHPTINLRYKEFIMRLIEEILQKNPASSRVQVSTVYCNPNDNTGHFPEKVLGVDGTPKRSDCHYCKIHKKIRKETAFICSGCKKRLCIQGKNSCFKLFHLSSLR